MSSNVLRSPIFYMGNKCKLMKTLLPLFPEKCHTFVDLFGGSGCVSMNYQGEKITIYNEFNENIVGLIKMIVDNEPEQLDDYFKKLIKRFDLVKGYKRSECENENEFNEKIKIAQNGFYKLRSYYNIYKNKDYKDLYLLSCYSINHLIRFNQKSEFNASCGATQEYNSIIYSQIQDMHEKFKSVIICKNNALELKLDKLNNDTFIYCDPPYLNTEAVYNEKRAFGGWNIENDLELFKLLEKTNSMGLKFGLSNVFENRGIRNNHLIKWCEENNWNVYHLDRNYNPFSRGNSDNDEVYVCNYKIKGAKQ